MPHALSDLFPVAKPLIAMIHVGALPGTPTSRRTVAALAERAAAEAAMLAKAGFDGLMIENMHDAPYVHGRQGPEVVAAMSAAALAVRAAAPGLPLGVQVLSGGHEEALAVALACGGSFIRVENFVYSHVADEGLLAQAAAGPLLRYRRAIGAEHIRLFCDIDKKHASHAVTADLALADLAHAAEFFRADGLIVTGRFTGEAADTDDLAEVRAATRLPILVGSGATPENLADLLAHADAAIVGSAIKRGGHWSAEPDAGRARALVAAGRRARAKKART